MRLRFNWIAIFSWFICPLSGVKALRYQDWMKWDLWIKSMMCVPLPAWTKQIIHIYKYIRVYLGFCRTCYFVYKIYRYRWKLRYVHIIYQTEKPYYIHMLLASSVRSKRKCGKGCVCGTHRMATANTQIRANNILTHIYVTFYIQIVRPWAAGPWFELFPTFFFSYFAVNQNIYCFLENAVVR